jgi:hypothetical protein
MARQEPTASAAVMRSSREHTLATAGNTPATTSTHWTLGRVMVGEQLGSRRHSEKCPRRTAVAALAAVPSRLRRPLRRRGWQARKQSPHEVPPDSARGGAGRLPQGAAATSTAGGLEREEEARRATADAAAALGWASPPVIAEIARLAASRRPTPIAAH